MQRLWGMKRMSVAVKMRCYTGYVLPILLFGCEAWALTVKQAERLERVHSSCLRQILGVRLCDRHTLEHIRQQCGTVSLAAYLQAARLRWLGHVVRMDEGRMPHVVLFSGLYGAKRPTGRPPMRWETRVRRDLLQLGLPTTLSELSDHCVMRGPWRSMVYRLTHPGAPVGSWQRSHCARERRLQQQLARRQQLLPAEEFTALHGVGWLCSRCGGIHPTRECTNTTVPQLPASD